jgi:hypothetical protein
VSDIDAVVGTFAIQTVPAKPEPLLCRLSGLNAQDMLVCGDTVRFSMQAVDTHGNDHRMGGHDFEVRLRDHGNGSVGQGQWEMTDNGDGTYSMELEPQTRGFFNVFVLASAHRGLATLDPAACVGGGPIPLVECIAGEVRPQYCTTVGDGLHAAVRGVPASFILEPRDRFGNIALHRPLKFSARFAESGPANRSTTLPHVSVGYHEDGRYLCTYSLVVTGKHSMTVLMDGKHIAGSPFTVNVSPGNSSALSTRL